MAEEHKEWCRIFDILGPCDCKGTPTREDWSTYHGRDDAGFPSCKDPAQRKPEKKVRRKGW